MLCRTNPHACTFTVNETFVSDRLAPGIGIKFVAFQGHTLRLYRSKIFLNETKTVHDK